MRTNRFLPDKLDLPQITNLTGLEHATQLKTLRLSKENISDISSLAQLTQLTRLNLFGNQIRDLTPLAQLTQLTVLFLSGNQIIDISPLAQLTQLTVLFLGVNQIIDISPLAQLTQLTELLLERNQIIDISPLAQLTQLTVLHLSENRIVTLPMAQPTQLTYLNLSYNQIRDVAPLAQLTQLRRLFLAGNQIRDVTPFKQLVSLEALYISYNQIRDVTPLKQLADASLTALDIRGNQIRDVSPLAALVYLEELSLADNPIENTFPLSALLDVNPDIDIDIAVIREEGGPTIIASTLQPLTSDTLNESVVTLTLRGGAYFKGRHKSIGEAITVSGIIGVTFDWTDIVDKVSDTEVKIKLTFDGTIEADTTLTVTVGPGAIENYNGPALTTEIPVSVPVYNDSRIAFESSTPAGYTHVTLSNEGVYGIPTKYTTDSDPGTVAYMLLGKVKGCSFATAELTRRSIVYIKTQSLGHLDNFVSETVCGKTSLSWSSSWDGVQITHLRFFDKDSSPNIQEAIYNNSTGQYDLTSTTSTNENDFSSTTPETSTDTDAVVSISPVSVASPAIGRQIEFSLNVTGGEAVAGYQASVQFDTTALRYVSGANGDYLPAGAFFVQPKMEGNLVKLNAVSLAEESDGDGTLATLIFEVIAVKPSTLTLSDVLLSNKAGESSRPQVDGAQITELPGLKGDVNSDGIVNIQDLVLVAANLSKTGQNAADINGDSVVNIQDLVLVAGALGTSASAPSLLHPDALETLTSAGVRLWLTQAQQLSFTDITSQRGILFLEQLLAVLIPKETALLANYPNPFNPETWIPYQLEKSTEVTITIYAVDGQVVRTLALGHQAAGMYQNRSRAAYWDGKNQYGEPVASGVYFYTLTAGDFSATRKMLICK